MEAPKSGSLTAYRGRQAQSPIEAKDALEATRNRRCFAVRSVGRSNSLPFGGARRRRGAASAETAWRTGGSDWPRVLCSINGRPNNCIQLHAHAPSARGWPATLLHRAISSPWRPSRLSAQSPSRVVRSSCVAGSPSNYPSPNHHHAQRRECVGTPRHLISRYTAAPHHTVTRLCCYLC
jgi:hypothetical protein